MEAEVATDTAPGMVELVAVLEAVPFAHQTLLHLVDPDLDLRTLPPATFGDGEENALSARVVVLTEPPLGFAVGVRRRIRYGDALLLELRSGEIPSWGATSTLPWRVVLQAMTEVADVSRRLVRADERRVVTALLLAADPPMPRPRLEAAGIIARAVFGCALAATIVVTVLLFLDDPNATQRTRVLIVGGAMLTALLLAAMLHGSSPAFARRESPSRTSCRRSSGPACPHW